jgi:HAD superfamily hydrolase (TIGR01490 family)
MRKVIIVRVAIFDFDGTLYKKETFKLLMGYLKKHPIYHSRYMRFFRWVFPRFIAYKMRFYPEVRMKERSMQYYISVLDDLSKAELEQYFQGATVEMEKDFNPLVVSKLEKHVNNDVHVMLVSGAYSIFIEAAISGLPLTFDTVIGSEIPFNEQRIDRNQSISHINGIRKNNAIDEALVGKNIDWENSFAYADSYSDLPVLELVGNPVAVQPDSKLKQIAQKRGWEII